MFQRSKILVLAVLGGLVILLINLWHKNNVDSAEPMAMAGPMARNVPDNSPKEEACAVCSSMTACEYKQEVDLRIIVLTYDRSESLRKCLSSLQELELMGDKAMVDIWIDVPAGGTNKGPHQKTLQVARDFRWRHGQSCVHVQTQHTGVARQWVYSWRPRSGDTRERAVFIEDDVDVSPYLYRFLRAADRRYGDRSDIAGIGLNDENILVQSGRRSGRVVQRPTAAADSVFLYPTICTWGFAPHPAHWRRFQDWFADTADGKPGTGKAFDPTFPEAGLSSGWFRAFRKQGREETMLHEMYFLRYVHTHHLYVVMPNLCVKRRGLSRGGCSLTTNRKEKGLHYGKVSKVTDYRLKSWADDLAEMPAHPKALTWNGSEIKN